MTTKTIISIDWDHTLRKMDGLNLNLLILILYAQAKKIPVGLTTHRDIENTTLYTLHHSQFSPPENNDDALAAAIFYWQQHIFSPLKIKFDFINARYQPICDALNYYESVLLPLETQLADDILTQKILLSPERVREKIKTYTAQQETKLIHNNYKEMQIAWLCHQYDEDHLSIIHLDDDDQLIQNLPSSFKNYYQQEKIVDLKTIHVEDESLLRNEMYFNFLKQIGFIDDAETFIQADDMHLKQFLFCNQRLALSLCLLLTQIYYAEVKILEKIKMLLNKLATNVTPDNSFYFFFAKEFVASVSIKKLPIDVLSNSCNAFLLDAAA